MQLLLKNRNNIKKRKSDTASVLSINASIPIGFFAIMKEIALYSIYSMQSIKK